MKRISMGLALLLALTLTCLAQAENKSDPREPEIRKFFAELDQSIIKRDDVRGDKFLHDEFTFVNPTGLVMNKERFVKFAFAGTMVYKEHKPEDLTIWFFGDAAICQGLLKFRVNMNGQARDIQARITVVIVKPKEQWQVFTYHSSQIPPPRPPQPSASPQVPAQPAKPPNDL